MRRAFPSGRPRATRRLCDCADERACCDWQEYKDRVDYKQILPAVDWQKRVEGAKAPVAAQ